MVYRARFGVVHAVAMATPLPSELSYGEITVRS